MCLNLTIHSQSEVYMVVRQLEFPILQLSQQLSEVIEAIQHVLLGKIPVSLLNAAMLRHFEKRVTPLTRRV
jgi:hypothetical protein